MTTITFFLNIAQMKAQFEYDDSLIENHMLLYQKVYKSLSMMRNRDMLDYKMITEILKEIIIDSTNKKVYIDNTPDYYSWLSDLHHQMKLWHTHKLLTFAMDF